MDLNVCRRRHTPTSHHGIRMNWCLCHCTPEYARSYSTTHIVYSLNLPRRVHTMGMPPRDIKKNGKKPISRFRMFAAAVDTLYRKRRATAAVAHVNKY